MAADRFRNWTPHERTRLLIPSGPVKHLFFVLTDPCPEQRVALVNLSSIREGRYYDPACILSPGDHPFVRNPTYARYEAAIILQVLVLRRGLDAGDFALHDPAAPALHEKLLEGLLSSDATP